MRDPYEVLGVPKNASAAGDQERLPAARQETASRRQQARPKAATRFAELNAAYEIVGDERQAQGVRSRRDRRRRQAALPGLRRRSVARTGSRTRSGRWSHFESFTWGPTAFSVRRRGRGGFAAAASTTFCEEMFGGAWRRRRAVRHAVRAGGFRAASGAGPRSAPAR